MSFYTSADMAELMGVNMMTVQNWAKRHWLDPAVIDGRGWYLFSQEQYDKIKDNLPIPTKNRGEFLKQFSVETIVEPRTEVDKSLLPSTDKLANPHIGSLYSVKDPITASEKITDILERSNALLATTLERDRVDIYNLNELKQATLEYVEFCRLNGVMPSFRRLANWYGYSLSHIKRLAKTDTETGKYLELIKDAVKDNLEQAALVNAVNNISAMFILKSQYDYVESTKVIVEPSNAMFGEPKSEEEIRTYIDADIIEE